MASNILDSVAASGENREGESRPFRTGGSAAAAAKRVGNRLTVSERKPLKMELREAFRVLRSNIEFTGIENRVIAVTSCLSNDGKSSVSWYLAEAFAAAGKKTVYVDADLRKSVLIHRLRIVNKVRGLSHYLSGQAQLSEVLYATDIQNLHLIPTGVFPPNPAELLGNPRFRGMINYLRDNFDYVIIDTPPLGNVIDAATVSQCCDGSVLVVASEKTSRQLAADVKNQLEMSNQNILGVVLNMDKTSVRGRYGKKGGYYGGYYGGYGSNESGSESSSRRNGRAKD